MIWALCIGEFVWTGFDYLGEPTPYDEAWPSHSSLFGILDLAGLPKDRYYLYRARWNTTAAHAASAAALDLARPRRPDHARVLLHQLPIGRAVRERQKPGPPYQRPI